MLATPLMCENQEMEDRPIEDDRFLLRSVAEKDRAAFEKLFRLYHLRIYKFALRLTNDHQRAEEVCCDTMYAVWQSAAEFRWQSSVSTWILGIAYRKAVKSYRSNSRHTHNHESNHQLEELEAQNPACDPEGVTAAALESRRILRAMDSLSADHRAVLELTALGHSCAEISGIVGCPLNTVKTRTFHARRNLKTALRE